MMKWDESDERFINPYNFVSLEEKATRSEDIQKGNLTGVIKCTLTTRSPLFIPNTENVSCDPEEPKHKVYEFFSYSRESEKFKPVIPASELRGLIRSAYETVTNSCLSKLDDLPITARTPRPKNKGIISWEKEKSIWVLYEAEKRTEESITEAAFLQGEITPPSKDKFGNKKDGKRNSHFFVKKSMIPLYSGGILENAVKNLKDVLELYRDPKKNINLNKKEKGIIKHTGYSSYKITKEKPFAVWYEFVGEKLYLAPACISRTAFYNTLGTAVGDYSPCNDKNSICKACLLFGMIGDKNAVYSKIRFSDGKATNFTDDKYMPQITLAELASPKKSAVEFYTYKPSYDAKVWNYDFKTVGYEGSKDKKSNLPIYKDIKKDELRIRGRKYYWHSGEILTQQKHNDYNHINEPKIKNERNVTVRPIKDTEFSFEVYYNNITEQQLKELLWVLTLGDNKADSNLCYKLGMGKPLGLGSVKITIDNSKEKGGIFQRKLVLKENDIEYSASKRDDFDNLVNSDIFSGLKDKKYYREFLEICNIDVLKKYTDRGIRVCYPCGDDGGNGKNSKAGHQWFLGNKAKIKSIFEAEFSYTLPEVLKTFNPNKGFWGVSLPKLIQINYTNNTNSVISGEPRNRNNFDKSGNTNNFYTQTKDNRQIQLECSECKKMITLTETQKKTYNDHNRKWPNFKCKECKKK